MEVRIDGDKGRTGMGRRTKGMERGRHVEDTMEWCERGLQEG